MIDDGVEDGLVPAGEEGLLEGGELRDGHPGDDGVALGEVADVGAGFGGDVLGVMVEDGGGAAGGFEEAEEDSEGGGFSGAIAAEDGGDGASWDGEGDFVEDAFFAEIFGEAGGGDDGVGHDFSFWVGASGPSPGLKPRCVTSRFPLPEPSICVGGFV